MQRKIAFMGTPNFCLPILKNIYQNGYDVSAVYTQPPKKSNRGYKIEKSPVHLLSETLDINVRTPDQLKNNKSEYEYFKNLELDLVIIVAYGKIVPKEFLPLEKTLSKVGLKKITYGYNSFSAGDTRSIINWEINLMKN